MKNIVLVTWMGGGNYGTSLQSFALHKKLEKLGYNVKFLCGVPKKFTYKNTFKYILQLLGIDAKKIKKLICSSHSSHPSVKQMKLAEFISKNYNLCKPINTQIQFSELIDNTDVFVTGSDQIWNTVFCFNPFYFLDFAEDAKRVAYASSVGLQDFPEEHKPEVKRMLSKFSHIGLREETAVKMVSKLLGRNNVVQVLDPTFLLDSNEWIKIGDDAKIEIALPEKYILCYLIGKNEWYKEQLRDVISKTGIKNVVIIPAEENSDFSVDGAVLYNAAGPLEFVKLIENAAFVCTDSFHATAISINLNVDFVEFMRFENSDKASQNSRIYDVLTHYGLMDRIYTEDSADWSTAIDFAKPNAQLKTDREKSLDYLTNAIEH